MGRRCVVLGSVQNPWPADRLVVPGVALIDLGGLVVL